MSLNPHTLLGQEWQTLQNNHEQYESHALHIKLIAILLFLAGLALKLPLLWIGFALALCWLLEGIFKTYQGRLGDRLLRVEALLGQTTPTDSAMQLHTAWQDQRPGGIGLLAGYAGSACRPTVTFPYLPLLLGLAATPYL